jgi:hypothetical protein
VYGDNRRIEAQFPAGEKRFFYSSDRSKRGSRCLLFNGHLGFFPPGQSGWHIASTQYRAKERVQPQIYSSICFRNLHRDMTFTSVPPDWTLLTFVKHVVWTQITFIRRRVEFTHHKANAQRQQDFHGNSPSIRKELKLTTWNRLYFTFYFIVSCKFSIPVLN